MDTIAILRRIISIARYTGTVASAFVVLIIGQYTLTSLLSYYGDTIQGDLTLASNYWQIMITLNLISIILLTVVCIFGVIKLRTTCYTMLYMTVITVAGATLLLLVPAKISLPLVAIIITPWIYDLAGHTIKTVRVIESTIKSRGSQKV